MFISDSIGAAKPDVKAFHTVQKEMKLDPEETWFIGDTFEIDVVGSQEFWLACHLVQPQKPPNARRRYRSRRRSNKWTGII